MLRHLIFCSSLLLCFHLYPSNGIPNRISIDCGSSATSAALSGREWVGDDFISKLKGSSDAVRINQPIANYFDLVPYGTARISFSKFSYTFQLNPGQKLIRLHFNPSSYNGYESLKLNDLFSVEAGRFVLLSNFSASLTAHALARHTFVKIFYITVQQNQPLEISFFPGSSNDRFYAFINGIEIISVSSGVSYCHSGEVGVQVVGQKSVLYVDSSSALELVRQHSIKWDFDEFQGLSGMWATVNEEKGNLIKNRINWNVSVDVGFSYLVKLHFCEVGHSLAENERREFKLVINNISVATSAEILQEKDEKKGFLWCKNFMVMVTGREPERKRDILISLQFKDELHGGGHRILGRFKIFKLSSDANTLANPNPSANLLPRKQSSPSQTTEISSPLLGGRNKIAAVLFSVLCLVNIVVYKLKQNFEANICEDEKNLSIRAKQLCRRFSLSEIQSATDNFFDGFLIGRGGFGKVYRGRIDNEQQTVAIKRLKWNSTQGKREFWTEIETLSEVKHVNLVSLIGYCNEQRELILVYEYMSNGTFADHLYELSRKNQDCSPLSWHQRLEICIGAARGLDYLHTSHGIVHRDVKPSNILLDDDFVPKVSDFGLAKADSERKLQWQRSTKAKGTIGYLDPDYSRTCEVTSKSDTYSFGVVLLEVLCGRPALDRWADEDERSLIMWARDRIDKGEVDQIVAPDLKDEISPDGLMAFVRIAEKCLQDDPKKRPAMRYILINLEFVLEQQDNGKALLLSGITSVADFFPPTTKISELPNVVESTADALSNGTSVIPIRIFTFSELKAATENFRRDKVLGRGGFGIVYRGWIDEKSTGDVGNGFVAVKRFKPESTRGIRGEWENEVNILGRLAHPNLVKLLGYCCEDKELLLVYEYMPMGSLDNCLYKSNSSSPLPWDTRLKILTGVARGVAFLHDINIQLRDVKTSNILLDKSYNAKICDFGLAKFRSRDGSTHVSTSILGTYGYAAPEYVATGHLYLKSDVYGFGVVLLEMMTGLRTFDRTRPDGQNSLVDWMKPFLHNMKKMMNILDSRLEIGSYAIAQVTKMAKLTLTCLEHDPKNRPSMLQIVETLEKMQSAA